MCSHSVIKYSSALPEKPWVILVMTSYFLFRTDDIPTFIFVIGSTYLSVSDHYTEYTLFACCDKTHYLRELWRKKREKCILFILPGLHAGKFCTWKDLLEWLPRIVRIGFCWGFHFNVFIKIAAHYHVQPVLQLRRNSFPWVSLLWCDLYTEVWWFESSERWFNILFTLQQSERALWPVHMTKQY